MRPHEVIKTLIRKRGVSVREVSRRIGVRSANTVAKWLTPDGDPRLSELTALAEFLDVPLSRLMGGDDHHDSTLTEAEWAVIDVLRALGLTRAEAIRRLAGAGGIIAASGGAVAEDRERGVKRDGG